MVSFAGCSAVGIAENAGVKRMAVIALAVVTYLYWSSFREKRAQRRERRDLAQRQRARETSSPQP